ncbi:gamma-glutamyl-gamma-aminobutyrate hydrolase family protein [Candidatus Sumerlaeota bacterium]|nr:gamma-glutamyl-gamma-aminobutyrate hydrolase family protein [Candidatus Sumerlaeota bacterium]
MKTLIGLTSNWIEHKHYAPSVSISTRFLDGVIKAGGFPVVLSAIMQNQIMEDIFDCVCGLIITGGPDLDPRSWNSPQNPMTEPMKSPRQEFELSLVKKAVERKIPILGVCLGAQLINVALGGTVQQDVPSAFSDSSIRHRKKVGCLFTEHSVKIAPDSLLFEVIGRKNEILVNSSHHQAVEGVAPGMRAVAWAPDGVIEAIESTQPGRPILAVQWHPEYLTDRQEHLNLFRWLVNAAEMR